MQGLNPSGSGLDRRGKFALLRDVVSSLTTGGKRMLRVTLALLALTLTSSSAIATQDWPGKTVKIVVPFGPGSTPDMVARLIADHLQHRHSRRS